MKSKHEKLLNKLSGLFDSLYEFSTDEERDMINEANDEIVNVILAQERKIARLEKKLNDLQSV